MMKQTEIKKFLIIGGGLAGTSLAHHLLQRNQSVQIIDGGENHSTRVAAGMVNPLVFRRTTLSWRAADFLTYSWDFYKSLERLLNITLAEPLVIRRIFPSEHEREEWKTKQMLPDFQAHLTPLLESEAPQNYKTTFGTGLVKSGFFVHAKDYYLKNRTYFLDLGLLKSKKFIPSLLDPISGSYENEVFDHIIFCTGYKNSSCPFFKNVPVKSTKGQTLEIKSTIFPEKESLHLKCFVFPIGQQKFRIGATYEWDNEELVPTETAKNHLLDQIKYISDEEIEVLSQPIGIRPTTMDRRPTMGTHPQFSKLHIFNGLGAKGYLLAPKLAAEMTSYLLDQSPLDPEVSLKRYKFFS